MFDGQMVNGNVLARRAHEIFMLQAAVNHEGRAR